jgi:hypothetical protein
MKVSIKKTEVYASMMGGGSAGKPIRQASISDTYGMGKPTRTNPVGGFMPMMCFGGRSEKVAHHAGCYRVQKEVLLMANNIAFQPMGNTTVAFAATGNTAGNVAVITAVSPCNQYFVFNPDKNDPVFVAYGETDSVTAVIPTDGSSAAVVAIAPYTEKTFTGPQVSATKTVYVRIISTHNNARLYITPGEGL